MGPLGAGISCPAQVVVVAAVLVVADAPEDVVAVAAGTVPKNRVELVVGRAMLVLHTDSRFACSSWR